MTTTQPSIDIAEVQRQLAPAHDFMLYHLFLPYAAAMIFLALVIAIVRSTASNSRRRR